MTTRRAPRPGAEPADEAAAPTAPARRRISAPPVPEPAPSTVRSREEAEAQYVTARDAWTAAMRLANSGRAAHLASLAITQEAFEAASAELELWRTGARIAIPIEPEASHSVLEAAVGQELAWRRILHPPQKALGLFSRLRRRLTRRG
jgi:hypothetical protein